MAGNRMDVGVQAFRRSLEVCIMFMRLIRGGGSGGFGAGTTLEKLYMHAQLVCAEFRSSRRASFWKLIIHTLPDRWEEISKKG